MAIKSFSSSPAIPSQEMGVSTSGTNIDKLIPILLVGVVIFVAYKYLIKPQMEEEQQMIISKDQNKE
jgi:hypothetical protein